MIGYDAFEPSLRALAAKQMVEGAEKRLIGDANVGRAASAH